MPAAPPPITLTLAHSADADDVFMWWPITGRIDPRNPALLLSPPAIDTGRCTYRAVPEDIQVLNERAAADGPAAGGASDSHFDITAISMFTYASVHHRYILTRCGWSLGEGFGPKLVARAHGGPGLDRLRAGSARIAVPGVRTTAFLVLSLMLGRDSFTPVPMRFDQITAAVSRGDVDAGVLIHESQLDHERHGLHALADLGAWWTQRTGGPLPLGANVVRRDCETRFGRGSLAMIESTLTASIRHARAHRATGLDYARTFSPPHQRHRPQPLHRYVRQRPHHRRRRARPRSRAAPPRRGRRGGPLPRDRPDRLRGRSVKITRHAAPHSAG